MNDDEVINDKLSVMNDNEVIKIYVYIILINLIIIFNNSLITTIFLLSVYLSVSLSLCLSVSLSLSLSLSLSRLNFIEVILSSYLLLFYINKAL